MKRILICFLTVAVLLSICGCSFGEEAPQTTGAATTIPSSAPTADEGTGFRVGYGRVLMNPEESIPLAGYGNESQRYCQDIIDDLYATCIAITDETGNTVLMMSADIAVGYVTLTSLVRENVSKQTGVPQEHIYIAGTHTHSGPAIGYPGNPEIERYTASAVQWMTQACVEALADRKEAQMYVGSVEAEGLNFVRHYKVQDNLTGEISYIGDNFGSTTNKTILEHATEADPTMYLVKFTREGCKDIVAVNWRAHPHFTGGTGRYDLSSDFVGTFRVAMEMQADCDFVYFQGAAGNINENSYVASEEACVDHRAYGTLLAEYAMQGLEDMTQAATGTIETKQVAFEAQINHSFDDLYVKAMEIQMVWQSTYNHAQCVQMGAPYGIRSPYHADAIVANYSRADTETITLNAVSIGEELSFVTFPGEMFDTNAVYVEENSPYATTLVLGYCNEHYGYMPSELAYEYSSYETDITRFARGTAEQVQQTYVEMLEQLSSAGE